MVTMELASIPREFPQFGKHLSSLVRPASEVFAKESCGCGGSGACGCGGDCGGGCGGRDDSGDQALIPRTPDSPVYPLWPLILEDGDGCPGKPLNRPGPGQCCIYVLCTPILASSGFLGAAGVVHCLIQKTSCSGESSVFELVPGVGGDSPNRVGGARSMVFAFPGRNLLGNPGYEKHFEVCHKCGENNSDSIACDCINKKSASNYPWRDENDYYPKREGAKGVGLIGGLAQSAANVADVSRRPWTNSNFFARYFAYRCSEVGKRPKMPPGAMGWDADVGRGADHPSPYGGVLTRPTGTYG